jgi:hypothetical protein
MRTFVTSLGLAPLAFSLCSCSGTAAMQPEVGSPETPMARSSRQSPVAAVATNPGQGAVAGPQLMTLRTLGDVADVRVSPDDRLMARPVLAEPFGQVIVIESLKNLDERARLYEVGPKVQLVGFSAATTLLTFDESTHQAALLPLDGGSEAKLACRLPPKAGLAGGELITVDLEGHLLFLNPKTLAVTWKLDAPLVPEQAAEFELSIGVHGIVTVTHRDGAFVVDRSEEKLLWQSSSSGAPLTGPFASRDGKYVATGVTNGEAGLWTLSIVDTAKGTTVFSASKRSQFAPVFAFSPEEKAAAFSFAPGKVTVVDLPSGVSKEVDTYLRTEVESFTLLTDALAFTEDGAAICGHAATSSGKYTDCVSQGYADAKRKRAMGRGVGCGIQGDSAALLPAASKLEKQGRKLLPSLSATYTHSCNVVVSPDHKSFGVATALGDRKQPGAYLDAEMNLVDATSGVVQQRLALGSATTATPELLRSEFSPKGRWLKVTFAGKSTVYDATSGRAVKLPPDVPEIERFSPDEAFGLVTGADALLVVNLDSGVVRHFPKSERSFCLESGLLAPASSCPLNSKPPTASASGATVPAQQP